MGLWDSIFGSKEKGGGFKEIPLTEDQKQASKFLENLMNRIMTFAPREVSGPSDIQQLGFDLAKDVMTGGVPGVSTARQALTKRMTTPFDIKQVPGLKGLFARTKELGADLLGGTKRGLAITGNLPSESSRGARIYGRTVQDIMNELITAASNLVQPYMLDKLSLPERVADLGFRDVATKTGMATTVGAQKRDIGQQILDAIFEAVRTTQTFPYQYQAPVAQNIMGQTRYGYQAPFIEPSIFSQIANPAAYVTGAYLKGKA